MSDLFAELDRQPTAVGEISLRRRRELTLDVDVYEVKLDDEFLMSSLFTEAEEQLAHLGLAAVDAEPGPAGLDVVVGGLGLGCTARAALEHPEVGSLRVVELAAPVIDWHHRGLLPDSAALTGDDRCTFVEGDFFALATGDEGFGGGGPGRVHAVLLDIDHTPSDLLHPRHGDFYASELLAGLAQRLHPGGVFALWSDSHDPDADEVLAQVFDDVATHVVEFPNPFTGETSSNVVYVARRG
ncbi:MAG: spermidine synthase [Acidimicrobiales bacterium]|nr:spermidine synthase [Acidimicrobiales bacterium]